MIPGPKELAWRAAPAGTNKALGVHRRSNVRVEFSACGDRKKRHAVARRSNPEKPGASYKTALLSLFCIPISVDWREAIPLFREIFERENSGHRANRYASATVDTFGRVDVELSLSLESRFILARMDTVHGADVHASGVFCADARLGNHVSHSGSPLSGQRADGPCRETARPAKISYTMRQPGA